MLSQLGGTYNGSITFVAPNKRFIWFAAQVNAASPKPEGEVKITTFVRKGETQLAGVREDAQLACCSGLGVYQRDQPAGRSAQFRRRSHGDNWFKLACCWMLMASYVCRLAV